DLRDRNRRIRVRSGLCAKPLAPAANDRRGEEQAGGLMNSELRWYVVHTQPHHECLAETNLRRQGFATYLPRYLRRCRHARRTETVPRPLFPRYLFVALDLARDRWRAVQSTFGVSHLVVAGDAPAPVPDGVVEEIWAR